MLRRLTWDTVGITASSICAVHCVLTPIALLFLPALVKFLPSELFHRWLVPIVFCIGTLAFVSGFRQHRRKLLLVPLIAGVALIAAGAFWIANETAEIFITMLGSASIIAAHVMNRTFCRLCATCEHGNSERCG